MDTPELQELVDAPRERLDVEYKAWQDPTDGEASAKLAKHLCALANLGGGFLVFGSRLRSAPVSPGSRLTHPLRPSRRVATFACERNLLSGHQVVLVDRTPAIRTRPRLSEPIDEEAPEVLGSTCRRRSVLGCVSSASVPDETASWTGRLVGGQGIPAGGRFRPRAAGDLQRVAGRKRRPARSDLGRRAAGNSLHLWNRDSCAMLDSAPISLTRAVREARRESSPSQAGPPWRC